MKYIDNDMDELFNKAGQDYPLNTDSKNWDAVRNALLTEMPAAETKKVNRYRRFLPLLLLLLLISSVVGLRETRDERRETKNEKREARNEKRETRDEQPLSTTRHPEQAKLAKELRRNEERQTADVKRQTGNEKRETRNEQLLPTPLHPEQAKLAKELRSNPSLPHPIPLTTSLPSENIKGTFTPKTYQSSTTPSASLKINKQSTTGFYYGIKAGVDLSSIKYQRIKHAGSSIGLLFGYQFAPHWSAEFSALFSTKQYYTDGKHFNKADANIPSSVEIYYLDGTCNMFELPIAVRYLFSPGRNSFFATAGVTSYFMNKEAYEYVADAGGGVYPGHRYYKNSGNHFFSNLQFSGGYQFKIFSKTNIRIEPYVLLPIKNVGVGKMPITSAGVHFGLMRTTR